MQTKTYTDERILKITGRIKIVFIIFIFIGVLDIIHLLLQLFNSTLQKHNHEGIVNLLIFPFLYYGLKLRKNWLIPLVLISSAFMLLNTGFHILQPVMDVSGLFVKLGSMVLFMFSIYQMYFFSRQEVKTYYGAKDSVFF